MPDIIDAPPVAEPVVTPAAEPKAKPGDKFRKAMGGDPAPNKPAAEPKPDKPSIPDTSDKPAVPDKPAADKPKRALDLAIAGDKAEDKTPAEDTPPAATEDVLKEFDASKKPNWERARGVMKTQSDEIHRLRNELDSTKGEMGKIDKGALESLPTIVKERDEFKKKNAELLDIVTALNVEYSPEFQEKYVKGRQKEIEKAISRVKEFGGDVEMFANALELKGKAQVDALRVALQDVDDMAKPRIVGILDRIQQLDEEAAETRSKPQQSFEQLEAKRSEEKQRAAEEHGRRFAAEFDKTLTGIRSKSPLLRTVDPTSEGGAEWNAAVKTAIETGRSVFNDNLPVERLIETAVKGGRYDAVEKMLLETQTENDDLQKRLKEYEDATPDHSKSGNRGGNTGAVKKAAPVKYREALASFHGGNVEV